MKLIQPFSTEHLRLREFEESDWEFVHCYFSNPEAYQFMEFGGVSEEDTKNYVKRIIGFQETIPRIHIKFALTLKKDNTFIGECGLHMPNMKHKEGEIVYRLNPRFWGRGYATEAGQAVVSYGFGNFELHRIEALCDVRNIGSIKVLEKLGMKREGCIREHKYIREAWRDSYIYSILEHEWAFLNKI